MLGVPPAILICEGLCIYAGFKEFIKLIQEEDPDPIYFCQVLEVSR